MLTISQTGDVIEVVESIHGWTHTKRTYWYYNLTTNMQSSRGVKDDVLDRPMNKVEVDWVKKHYIPRLAFDCSKACYKAQ